MCTLYENVDYFLYEYEWIICCEHLEFVLNPMASHD